ncbi:MAG: aldo/keto reductase [SAR324 cluster bacterium]|nr:aldo/keto reductase [SAR324 cluster bacterium]
MPLFGLGVWAAQSGQETYDAVLYALKTGYRHIDTAEMYGNEKDVGKAVVDSGINRADVFVTTKLWDSGLGYDHALKAFDVSLQKMKLDYVDLYLIHWPENRSQLKIWRALERIKKEGRTRSIGVSNFAPKHLKELLVVDSEHPVVNQVELSPFLQQKHIYSFCQKENIHLTGYCPLSRGNRFNDSNLSRIAKETKKSAAQVMIRWALQRGHTVIPKSVSPARIEENADVFDFNLNNQQMKILDGLEEGLRFCPDPAEIQNL